MSMWTQNDHDRYKSICLDMFYVERYTDFDFEINIIDIVEHYVHALLVHHCHRFVSNAKLQLFL